MRQFYRNFADYFFETIKLGHITDDEIKKRMEFVGLDAIDDCIERGESVGIYLLALRKLGMGSVDDAVGQASHWGKSAVYSGLSTS